MIALVQQVWRQGCTVAFILAIVGLTLICGVNSIRWIGVSFPGFFVMANRVVAAVSLPHWPVTRHHNMYHSTVVAVNGQPVTTSEELYTRVRDLPSGSPIAYTLEKDGRISQIVIPSITFTPRDSFLLFGSYLFSGLALALIGIGVWFLNPSNPASLALCIGGGAGGLFAITGADLYGPHWFFRLHILGEAFFPAGFVHLALVFPIDHLRRFRSVCLAVPYVVAFSLAVAYQWFLYQPTAYSMIYNLCMVYVGVGALIFLGRVVWDYSTTDSHLTRQRIRVILWGFLSGFSLPAILMFSSGITGGEVAVNYAGFTAFLFPLSLGYAIVKHDLFEIDAMLKRGVYYFTFTVTLAVIYITLLAIFNFLLHASEFTRSPFFPLFFALAVAFLLNPLKEQVQSAVDRVFFRLRYNPKKVLAVTSASLAATLQLEEILSLLWTTIRNNLGVHSGGIFLLSKNRDRYILAYPRLEPEQSLPITPPLVREEQQRSRVVSLYDLDTRASSSEEFTEAYKELVRLDAQLLVPLVFKNDLIGMIALGKKESGSFFSVDDRDFLSTLANQGALSIANAVSYQEIQVLNTSLEQKVTIRTQELAQTNHELQRSLERLEQAYRDLQRSQESLIRAEKMAALGRLTAGIAHEVNTPLGASLTSLKLLQELVEEYLASIGDSVVSEQDHYDIASEMNGLVRATQQWLEKAAEHIRSLKLHTRDLHRGEARSFSILHVVEDTGLLLSHRLRLSQCTLTVSCPSAEPVLYGDPGKLSQVFTNLIVNAIDAYKEAGRSGAIGIEIEDRHVFEIRVTDNGCGIPPEHMGKIFDEFFSTKPLGEGTGLGLAIARDIVTSLFGGTITAESIFGQGSVFTLRLPRASEREREPSFSEKRVPSLIHESLLSGEKEHLSH